MRAFARSMKALGLVCLILTASPPLPASQAGRDFSACVRACNGVRIACVDQCLIDCRGLFPQNTAQRAACTSSCTRTCVKSEADCKAVCRAIKSGGSPSQP